MKKNWKWVILFFALSFICFVTYSLIGSKVELDGTLVEPFALIPLGYIFLIIGGCIAIIKIVKHLIKK